MVCEGCRQTGGFVTVRVGLMSRVHVKALCIKRRAHSRLKCIYRRSGARVICLGPRYPEITLVTSVASCEHASNSISHMLL